MLNTTGPPDFAQTNELEADVPLDVVGSLETAIHAGDLELFDPVEGFTGIRVRDASEDFQRRWRSGQDGVLQVLAAVEAHARLRESVKAQNR